MDDNFGPGVLLYVHDLTRKPGSRIELGVNMHKFLAENPDALPTLAVDMIVCAINEVAVDQEEARRLQWQVTEAMTEKLKRFKRLVGGPEPD